VRLNYPGIPVGRDGVVQNFVDRTTTFNNNFEYAVLYQCSGVPNETFASIPSSTANSIWTTAPVIREHGSHRRTIRTAPAHNISVNAKSGINPNTIEISFEAHSGYTGAFQIEYRMSTRADANASWETWGNWGDMPNGSGSFDGRATPYVLTHSSLPPCSRFEYRVRFNFFESSNIHSGISGIAHPQDLLRFVGGNLRASKGEFANRVQLEWSVQGHNNTDVVYRISRRVAANEVRKGADSIIAVPAGPWVVLATITSRTTVNSWFDDNAEVGIFYEYRIELVESCAADNVYDIGFIQAAGTISGRVTFGNGQPVAETQIRVRRNTLAGETDHRRSLHSDGTAANRFEWVSNQFNDIWMQTQRQWTLQFWINPSVLNTGDTIIGNIGEQPIRLVNVGDNLFQIYTGFNTAITARSATISANEFSHITITRNDNDMRIYTVARDWNDDNTTTFTTEHIPENLEAIFVVNSNRGISLGQSFIGYIDEVRFWNRALPTAEIRRDFNRYLLGNESGLIGYWPFNCGLRNHAFDISRVGTVFNNNHATRNMLRFAVNVPDSSQLAMKGITDSVGNYMIRGIPYQGEGTSYIIVPSFSDSLGNMHVFNPQQQVRFISHASSVHNGTDFVNISSFPVSGRVLFRNSNYPVVGANVYISGQIAVNADSRPILTDSEGRFTVDVPIGQHFITVSKQGHEFMHSGRFPTNPLERHLFQAGLTLPDFIDTTTVRLVGRVVGGQIETDKDFGDSRANIGAAEIVLRTRNDRWSLRNRNQTPLGDTTFTQGISSRQSNVTFESNGRVVRITTNPTTGEFVANLPPVPFEVINISTAEFDTITNFTVHGATIIDMDVNSLEAGEYRVSRDSVIAFEYHATLRATRFNTPTVNVRDITTTVPDFAPLSGAFGDRIFRHEDFVNEANSRDIPLHSVNGEGNISYALGFPVFSQETGIYTWEISAFEEYRNPANNNAIDRVPLAGARVDINNGLSRMGVIIDTTESELAFALADAIDANENLIEIPHELVLNSDGRAIYVFQAGFPNLAGDNLLSANVGVWHNGVRFPRENGWELKAFLFGQVPVDGNNFVTQGPDVLDFVLFNPPGSSSSAFVEAGSSMTVESTVRTKSSDNNSTTATTHIGYKLEVGKGAFIWKKTTVDVQNDFAATVATQNQTIVGRRNVRTTTFNSRIQTNPNSDPGLVGTQGNLFVGTSTNWTFGKARHLALTPRNLVSERGLEGVSADGFYLYSREMTSVGLEFGTTFSYSQHYILGHLIPNLEKLRNDLIRVVDVIPNAWCPNIDSQLPDSIRGRSQSFTTLEKSDPDFGTDGTVTTLFNPDLEKEEQFDHFLEFGRWIEMWQNTIRESEQHQAYVFNSNAEISNRSFDSGARISESTSVSLSQTRQGHEINMIEARGSITCGVRVNGTGMTMNRTFGASSTRYNLHDTTGTNNLVFGFTLATTGINDALSVDVARPVLGEIDSIRIWDEEIRDTIDVFRWNPSNLFGYVFRLRAGQTSCPHESEVKTRFYRPGHILHHGTFQVENPVLYINGGDTATLANVASGREASFNLALQNWSAVNRTITYQLEVDETTNPDGLIISIDGTPLTTPRRFNVPFGRDGELTKSVRVRQEATDILDYDYVRLVLRSICDSRIADTVHFSAFFLPGSSPITLAANSTIINHASLDTAGNGSIRFTISEYDRTFRNFGLIRLQMRNATDEQWTTIQEYVNDEELFALGSGRLPIDGHSIAHNWDFTGTLPRDGAYYFRALTVSRIGSEEITTSSEEIRVSKDVLPPRSLGLPSPANGILSIGDEISITFNEDIQSGLLTRDNFRISGVLNEQEIAFPNVGLAFTGNQSARTEVPIFADGSFSVETRVMREAGTAGTLFAFGAADNFISLGFNEQNLLVLRIGNESYTSVNAVPNNGSWQHIAMSYNRQTNSATVYLASNPVINNRPLDIAPETQGRLIVGNNSAGSDGFRGAVAHLHFYGINRTGADIAADFNIAKTGRERGLTGYWALDEGRGAVATDKVRGRNLLVNTDWYLYPLGRGMTTGQNAYISIPTYTYPLDAFSDFTVEFWFRSENNANQNNAVLLSGANGFVAVNSAGGLTLFGGEKNEQDMPVAIRSLSTQNLMNTQWTHFAMTVRRGGNVNVFINGENTATFAETALGSFGSSHFFFGAQRVSAENNTFDNWFTGTFDEIRIWNSALTREGVMLNKNNALSGSEAGLLAYYPFEDFARNANGTLVVPATITETRVNMADITGATLAGGAAVFAQTGAPITDIRPTQNVPFDFVSSNNKIVLTIDPAYFHRVEGAVLNISATNVRDMHNNPSATENWTAFVRRNALLWESDPVSIIMEEGETRTFTARITNVGGVGTSFAIENLPSWLTVNASAGNLQPLASRDLTFTTRAGINIGNYETAIGLSSGNGIVEMLPVQLQITGERPDWIVNPNDFTSSMNILGQIKIDGVFRENSQDILAAFIGEQCVGIGSPVFVEEMNAWFVFFTIYGNAQHNGQALTFKLWDAATGRIFPQMETSVPNIRFAPLTVIGSVVSPVIFDAANVSQQIINLQSGWNWISANVLNSNPTIFAQMQSSLSTAGVLIKGQSSFVQQGASNWIGTLSNISEKSMYQVNVVRNHALALTGTPANPAATQISVDDGWNWISYIPSFSLPVNNALAGLNAQIGDIIKSQTGFSMYVGASGWVGTLEFMQAGQGYMYFSNNAAPQTFVYPSQASQITARTSRSSSVEPRWTTDPRRFASTMTITAVVANTGVEARSDKIEIGAFSGNEVRGSAFLQFVPSLNRYVAFLMVYGEGGESIQFRVFDHSQNREIAANNSAIPFVADAFYGIPDFYAVCLGHDWSDWNTSWNLLSAATCTVEGMITSARTCNTCGNSGNLVRLIPRLSNCEEAQRIERSQFGGIVLEDAIVSRPITFEVITPEPSEIRIMIYDNLGNLVFDGGLTWNLRNTAGRYVANGSYLVVAEAISESGKIYMYTAKIGVRR